MSHFTVLGAQGFIGARMVEHLAGKGFEVLAPPRQSDWTCADLGHVIYAAGVTHDFAARPFDTLAAHVSRLAELLSCGNFDSLLYLSSTRVYQGLRGTVDESANLIVNPARSGDLYNLSKLAGESLALASKQRVRVVRLSNVYDAADRSSSFLPSVLQTVAGHNSVSFHSGPGSTRDYVSLRDVLSLLPRIALHGRLPLYNLSSATNVTHAELGERLATLTGCQVNYAPGAVDHVLPRISNRRLADEFDWQPAAMLDDLPELLAARRAPAEALAC
jgi:nucleoside-diphosphate-sugar epimerase